MTPGGRDASMAERETEQEHFPGGLPYLPGYLVASLTIGW